MMDAFWHTLWRLILPNKKGRGKGEGLLEPIGHDHDDVAQSDDVGIQALQPLLDASPALQRLASIAGGEGGGTKALAQALSKLALTDLAMRAATTEGRNADRLWAPVLAYASRNETNGAPNVSITGSQVVVALQATGSKDRLSQLDEHRIRFAR
jgi:hypothetical protein